MNPIVIIGSGLAGWTLVRELRKSNKDAPVVLISADAGDFYSKPMLSNALAQNKTAAQLVTTPAATMAEQQGITLMARTRVEAIDRERKVLTTSAGEQPYSALALALGADPIRLPLGGDAAGAVLSVNDLDDYARFRDAIAGKRRIAVIGAGLIGCEFANDLAAAGYVINVYDPTAHPLSSLLPEAAGRSLLSPLAALGVAWHFGRSVRAVDRAGEGFRLTLDDGTLHEVDAVLSAVGLRPRTLLAKEAGLDVNRGIVTDEYLRTSDAAIYALGDCAETQGAVRPYVLPIMHSARALARTLAGEATAVVFPPMPVMVKTPACPATVVPVARDAVGSWEIIEHESGVKATFSSADGKLLGFALTGKLAEERMALAKLLAG